jgi:hypothetical protein
VEGLNSQRYQLQFPNKKFITMKTVPGFTARMLYLYLVLSICAGCEKEIKMWLEDKAKDHNVKRVSVSNVSELYTAVNDPLNVGSQIVLAAGTYVLDASKPNGGRLELQLDMQLLGQPGHPENVIIDASPLPASSFILPVTSFPSGLRTGSIRTGKGSNSVEWMTLVGNSNSTGIIDTDLTGTPTSHVKVSHTVIKQGGTGINIRNRDEQNNDHLIVANIMDNDITQNAVGGFGIGIWIWNARNAHNAAIKAALGRNYVHGNTVGLSINNVTANQCRVEVTSTGDRIEANGLGISIGNSNQYPALTSNDNVLSLEAHGTSIINNKGIPAPDPIVAPAGGITVTSSQVNPSSRPGTVNNNTVNISLWDSRVEENVGAFQVNLFAARSLYPSSSDPAGTHNLVNAAFYGISKNASINVVPSLPEEPAGTNKVNVYR